MTGKKLTPLTDPGDIPDNMTEQEAREFWQAHSVTEEYLRRAGSVDPASLPNQDDGVRTVTVRIDADTLRRIKALARRTRTGHPELLRGLLLAGLESKEREAEALTGR